MLPTPGTESDTGLDRWSPELRRAVMVARPEFFVWSAAEQLRYRVTLPDDDREAIVAALLREHGERRPAALAKLEAQGRVPLDLQNRIKRMAAAAQGNRRGCLRARRALCRGQQHPRFRDAA